jgi:hypothetical protein
MIVISIRIDRNTAVATGLLLWYLLHKLLVNLKGVG